MSTNRYEYFVFNVGDDPRAGVVEDLDSKIEEDWLLSEGTRVGQERFPPSTEVSLAKDGGNLLTDFIDNIHSVVIVSQKAKDLLVAEGQDEQRVEYLPFVLLNKRHKRAPGQYYIANVLEAVDCFDWERSVYRTFTGTQEISYSSLRRLHVQKEKIPDTARLFRLGELKDKILIRSDLLERLRAAGCTGINVLGMGDYIP